MEPSSITNESDIVEFNSKIDLLDKMISIYKNSDEGNFKTDFQSNTIDQQQTSNCIENVTSMEYQYSDDIYAYELDREFLDYDDDDLPEGWIKYNHESENHNKTLTREEYREYCSKKFNFKTIKFMSFSSWDKRREYIRMVKADRRCTDKFKDKSQLMSFLVKQSADKNKIEVRKFREFYPPNRFSIIPGFQWDGVDKSNGFCNKIYKKHWKMKLF